MNTRKLYKSWAVLVPGTNLVNVALVLVPAADAYGEGVKAQHGDYRCNEREHGGAHFFSTNILPSSVRRALSWMAAGQGYHTSDERSMSQATMGNCAWDFMEYSPGWSV